MKGVFKMKKSLIALAVAGAVVAPAAFADSANANLYGIMSFSVDWANTNEGGDDSDLVTGRDNVSRIGMKGSEDLGNGLSAIWQAEMALNASFDGSGSLSGTGTNSWRNTFVGLSSGSMGTVVLGRHDTPYKLATAKLDPFADTLGDYNAIIGATSVVRAGSVAVGATGFDIRAPQTIAYITPNWSGFSAAVAYVEVKLNDDAIFGSNSENTNAWSVMGMYENGPIFGSLAYEKHNGALAFASAPDDSQDAWKLGLGYSFGPAQVGFVYENLDDDLNHSPNSRDAWYLSGVYNLGAIDLKAAYGKADNSDAPGPDDGADFWVIGADYNFSKRTKLYAMYATVNNDNAGTYGLVPYSAQAVGEDVDGVSVGIKHTF
jgi:predicted porin